jgi:hypothetical protein
MWNLKLSLAIVFITINSEAWWAGLEECGAGEQIVWRLNVWAREVAAGGNLNDSNFTLHSNLLT